MNLAVVAAPQKLAEFNHLVRSMFAFVVLASFQKNTSRTKVHHPFLLVPSILAVGHTYTSNQKLRVTEKTPTVSERQSRYSGLSRVFWGGMSGTLKENTIIM